MGEAWSTGISVPSVFGSLETFGCIWTGFSVQENPCGCFRKETLRTREGMGEGGEPVTGVCIAAARPDIAAAIVAEPMECPRPSCLAPVITIMDIIIILIPLVVVVVAIVLRSPWTRVGCGEAAELGWWSDGAKGR